MILGLLMVGLSACGSTVNDPAGPGSTTATTSVGPSTSGPQDPTTASVSSPTSSAASQVVSVTVRRGQVQGPSLQRVSRNETVTVRVTSDVADTIHVYGYDKTTSVGVGETAELTLVTDVSGIFMVGLERSNQLLFDLEVRD